jgi:hypothetical protein
MNPLDDGVVDTFGLVVATNGVTARVSSQHPPECPPQSRT